MKIKIDEESYFATVDTTWLAMQGECITRSVFVEYPTVKGTTDYFLRVEMPDMTVYDLKIVNNQVVLTNTITAYAATIPLQWIAKDNTGAIIAKSQIIHAVVKDSIDGDSSALPTPEAFQTKYNECIGEMSSIRDEVRTLKEQIDDGVNPEVTQARVDANGTTYSTLKERLDSTDENVEKIESVSTELKGGLGEINNVVFYIYTTEELVNTNPIIEVGKSLYTSTYVTIQEQSNSSIATLTDLVTGETLYISSTVMNTEGSWGFTFTDNRNKTIYHYFDESLSGLTDKTNIEVIVPEGATKLYVSRLNSKGQPEILRKEMVEHKTPKVDNSDDVLYGKKLVVFGDSMAYGHTIPDKVWVKLLADKHNMELTNKAQNGTTIVRKTTTIGDSQFLDTDSVYAKVMDNLNNPVDADYVVVFGGTNDIARNDQCPLGTIDDTSSQTFYGALNAICQRLIQTYPTGNICFVTPYIRNAGLATTEICKQYVKAIHDVCEKWGGIPVFDNTVNGALDFSNSYQANTLTMQDSYHLNEDGHKRAMHKYEVFLQSI